MCIPALSERTRSGIAIEHLKRVSKAVMTPRFTDSRDYSEKSLCHYSWEYTRSIDYFKAGVHLNLIAILGSLKRDWKGEKRVMENHQTVARPHNGTPGFWATGWCVYTNF